MKNNLSRKTKFWFFFFLDEKRTFDQKSHFSEIPQNSNVTLRCTGLLKKKELCENLGPGLQSFLEVKVTLTLRC